MHRMNTCYFHVEAARQIFIATAINSDVQVFATNLYSCKYGFVHILWYCLTLSALSMSTIRIYFIKSRHCENWICECEKPLRVCNKVECFSFVFNSFYENTYDEMLKITNTVTPLVFIQFLSISSETWSVEFESSEWLWALLVNSDVIFVWNFRSD